MYSAVNELVKLLALPEVARLIPELTRASCHRGEVYDLKHHELFISAVRMPLERVERARLLHLRDVSLSLMCAGAVARPTERHQARTVGLYLAGPWHARAFRVRSLLQPDR